MVNSCRETPGPIPNPEAKPAHADGTATGRLWESKSPPTPNNNKQLNNPEGKETVNHRLLPLFSRCTATTATQRNSWRAGVRRRWSSLLLKGFRPHGTAYTCRESGRKRTLNQCFYPRFLVGCDSGDPCGFRAPYSNRNTPTGDTCSLPGIL